jgi:hypothetical protein
MTNPINAPVEAMKGADSQAPPKLVIGDTSTEQLLTRDQAVGPAGDLPDPLLDRPAAPAAASFLACLAI